MHAVRIHAFGGPETLRLEEVGSPTPVEGEALVRVRGSGVNPVDVKIREGEFPDVGEKDLPVTLGREVAGVVIGVGETTDLKVGDEVLAHLGWDRGGYAGETLVRPGEWARKPSGVSWETAAALPLCADTADQGLFEHGRLRSGQRVLIHGGAGGVGHLAVQLAKQAGAYVFATAGARHVEFVRSLGADVVIDYKAQRFEEQAAELDLVYDLQGGETRSRSWALLKPKGRLVTTTHDGDVEAQAAAHDLTGVAYMAQPRGSDLQRIVDDVARGDIKVHVDRTFPFQDAAAAHRALEHDHSAGKLVLTP